MAGFKELGIYIKSYELAKSIYDLTKSYPNEERYAMIDQMRRASLSVPLNIAEGYAKKESQAEFRRFLLMALGSANEMLVLLDFSKDLGYISDAVSKEIFDNYEEVCRMLNSFIKSLGNTKNSTEI